MLKTTHLTVTRRRSWQPIPCCAMGTCGPRPGRNRCWSLLGRAVKPVLGPWRMSWPQGITSCQSSAVMLIASMRQRLVKALVLGFFTSLVFGR